MQIPEASFPISYGFEDIAITQNKNICESRLDADTTSEVVRGVFRPVPMIASNMNSVVNADFCIKLDELGAIGMMHRADKEENILKEVRKIADNCSLVCASIGIGNGQFEFTQKLIENGANIICIDIAHGYSDTVIELGRKIKQFYPNVKLILGTTINTEMLKEVHEFADAIRVGLATGSACETKNTAACYEKQFSAVYKFKELSRKLNVPIISDGGIKEPADMVKAIAAGANSIMAGGIFARCPESAAEITHTQNGAKKVYFGMASRKAQDGWRGGVKGGTCPEGGTRLLDIGENVDKLIERYTGALRSGITYGGGNDIKSFQDNVRFVRFK